MCEKLRKKLTNHDMSGEMFVFGEKLRYVGKNFCIFGKNYVGTKFLYIRKIYDMYGKIFVY